MPLFASGADPRPGATAPMAPSFIGNRAAVVAGHSGWLRRGMVYRPASSGRVCVARESSTNRAAANPEATAPSIVAGNPVSV